MRAVIFAGGVGTRLWPLSRKKSPKQFEKIMGDKSTLQATVERLLPEFAPEDIFISTGDRYSEMVLEQLPFIPPQNIIGEPYKKDVGPAVAYAVSYIKTLTKNDNPVVILWSDHMVRRVDRFKKLLAAAGDLLQQEPNKIVFIGQQPRFASDNLGWIEFGDEARKIGDVPLYAFAGFKYRPSADVAKKYFEDKKHYCWNLGYFVIRPSFLEQLFQQFVPDIHKHVTHINEAFGTDTYKDVLKKHYELMPSINFDNALLEKLTQDNARVIVEDIGWSDVGAWEALKEALEKTSDDNVTNGKTTLEECYDNLVYNYEPKKLVVGIDLESLLIVNTSDVLLIAKKTSVGKIKTLVESFKGTENESLT